MPTETLVSLDLQTSARPPDAFRIFARGENRTRKGTFLLDEEALSSVLMKWRAHGSDLSIDYGHAAFAHASGDAGKAAGWFDLDARSGELWATNVRWTTAAARSIGEREWRYISPTFTHRDGRIVELHNVALTNVPATIQAEALVAASTSLDGPHVTDDGIEVPGELELIRLGLTQDEFISTARMMAREGSYANARATGKRPVRGLVHASRAREDEVDEPIEVPSADELVRLGISREDFIQTAFLMKRDGSLK